MTHGRRRLRVFFEYLDFHQIQEGDANFGQPQRRVLSGGGFFSYLGSESAP